MTEEEIQIELDKLRQSMIHGTTYRESYALDLLEMFRVGKTLSQFCAEKEIGRETFNKWRKRHKLLDAAYLKANDLARAYYDNLRHEYLLEDAEGLKLNWGAFNKMYSARFNIADKRMVKVKGLGKAKDEREMLKCLNKAIEEEDLTPEEAQKLSSLIDVSLKIKQTEELEVRLTALEQGQTQA